MKFGCYILVIENHMKRIPGYHFEFGWGQGYVLLPEFHPFYGVHYDDIDVDIHGGLTFSEKFESDNFLRWTDGYEIGGDITKDNFRNFNNYWIIGFDTNHSSDNLVRCSKTYVLNQSNYLLDQCVNSHVKEINIYKSKLRCEKLKKINIIDKKE